MLFFLSDLFLARKKSPALPQGFGMFTFSPFQNAIIFGIMASGQIAPKLPQQKTPPGFSFRSAFCV